MSHILPLTAKDIERRLFKVDDLAIHESTYNGSEIQVTLTHFIENGSEIKFKAPVDCAEVTRLCVQYTTKDGQISKVFAFADANGNDVGEVANLFAKDAVVKVVLDLNANMDGVDGAAFVQNANTNSYLENRLAQLEEKNGVQTGEFETANILNDLENNKAITPYSMATGTNTQAGTYGYRLKEVRNNDGKTAEIIVDDADLSDKARDKYAVKDTLCFDGKSHFYTELTIAENGLYSIDIDGKAYSVIKVNISELTVKPTTGVQVDTNDDGSYNTDEKENWAWVAGKSFGIPMLRSQGAFASGVAEDEDGELILAIGYGAFASGRNTKAIGDYAHTEGRDTIANYAGHAEGRTTKALNQYAHAEGYKTQALAIASHAEGANTIATGERSHAEGTSTQAIGNNSHAENSYTQANGNNSHAEGAQTIADGDASHTEGNHTKAIGIASHAEGGNFSETGTGSAGFTIKVDAETSIEIVGSEARGIQAHAEGTQTLANGYSSHSEGYRTAAIGKNSHVEGHSTRATSESSHAEGGYQSIKGEGHGPRTVNIDDSTSFSIQSTEARGVQSHAEGTQTISYGYSSHSEGYRTDAIGSHSHAEGNFTQAIGEAAHAEGYNTKAVKNYTHAEGHKTQATELYSHAEGKDSIASGTAAHAEGGSTASGQYSHAEGYTSQATVAYSHAEGYGTIVGKPILDEDGQPVLDKNGKPTFRGTIAHAEGRKTEVYGNNGHAEGNETIVNGDNAHAEGHGTIASGTAQHVQGKYNVEDTNNTYAHIVGNGTSNTNRKNIHTLDWKGNTWFAGDITLGATNYRIPMIYSGTSEPGASLGKDGDVYIMYIDEE